MWNKHRLRILRNQAGLTIRELADKLNVSESSIASYEQGKITPSLTAAIKFADYFGVSLDYLLGRLTLEEEREMERECGKHFMRMRKEAYEQYLMCQRRKNAEVGKYDFPYPYNLVRNVFRVSEKSDCYACLTDDQIDGLNEALRSLKPRHAMILHMYYEEGKTLEVIGKEFFIGRERVRQIIVQALRILRSGKNKLMIEYGLSGYQLYVEEQRMDRKIEELKHKEQAMNNLLQECTKKETVLREDYHVYADCIVAGGLGAPLEQLDLSARSYHALRTYFFLNGNTNPRLGDVLVLYQNDALYDIRNLGRKSCAEIADMLRAEGCLAS